jgi:hypothetical protein
MAAAGQGDAEQVAAHAMAAQAAAVQAAADEERQEELEVASMTSRRPASIRGAGSTDRQLAVVEQSLSSWFSDNDLPQAFSTHLNVASAATVDGVVNRIKERIAHLPSDQKRDFDLLSTELTILLRRKEKADSRDLAEALRIRYLRTETQIAPIRNPRTPRSVLQRAIADATATLWGDLERMRKDGEADGLFGGRNTDDLIVAAMAEERPETAPTDDGEAPNPSAAGTPVRGGPRSFYYFTAALRAVDECCTILHRRPTIKVTKSAEGAYPWFRAICQGNGDVLTAVTGDNMLQQDMVGLWATAWDAAAPGELVELNQGSCAIAQLTESVAVILTLHYRRTSANDYMPLSGTKYYALCKALLDRTTPDTGSMRMPDSAVLTAAHLPEVPLHVQKYAPFSATRRNTTAGSVPVTTAATGSYTPAGAYRGRGRGYGGPDWRDRVAMQPSQGYQAARGGRGGVTQPAPMVRRGGRECYICAKPGHQAAGCPERGKCINCNATGHTARDCPKPPT